MARLVAAFASSHSIMLAATRGRLDRAFSRDPIRRMPLFDRDGTRARLRGAAESCARAMPKAW